ncbi:hypothetical protein ACQP1O_13475 [Nocardia sp. CA-151230]|uniref:hypothetical protein n=1 Tax=Nocardia sp. CA-151230 TaxID=3239982 RepID=UPI003D8CBB4E
MTLGLAGTGPANAAHTESTEVSQPDQSRQDQRLADPSRPGRTQPDGSQPDGLQGDQPRSDQPVQWPAAEAPNVHPYQGLRIPDNTLSSLQWARPMPENKYLAPLGELHLPVPVAPVPPIAPPAGKLRFGDVQVDSPEWLNREQAIQLNDGAAQAEAATATFLDSIGMERSRSDRVAGEIIGGAAVGIAAGAVAASPFGLFGGVVGGMMGTVIGLPFAPIGLAAVPVGAAYGAALMEVPIAAFGAGIGASLGAVHALSAPPRAVAD